MTIHSDIVTALAGVASGKVYPDAAPEGVEPPLVLYRRVSYDPLMTLQGYAGLAQSTFLFECWGKPTTLITAKASALALAASVQAAIDASTVLTSRFRVPVTGEEYDVNTMELMEPVQYSFWHA